jgi:hypothetical protein
VSDDRCPVELHDGGPPLRCVREAGHPGLHSATDDVWWLAPGDPQYTEFAQQVEQVSYPDGVSVADVLDDIREIDEESK